MSDVSSDLYVKGVIPGLPTSVQNGNQDTSRADLSDGLLADICDISHAHIEPNFERALYIAIWSFFCDDDGDVVGKKDSSMYGLWDAAHG